MDISENLQRTAGIDVRDIDKDALLSAVLDAYAYHEGIAESSVESIAQTKSDPSSNRLMWDRFETNNIISYCLRDILAKSSKR